MYISTLFFFQGPIGRDIKTTVKIKNILFATFNHTYQLLFHIVDAPTQTFFVAWYKISNILVIEASRQCFQPNFYAGLQLIVPNVVLLRNEMKITGSQVRAYDGGLSNTSHRKRETLQEPLCYNCGMRPCIVTKDNIPRRLFRIKESNYSTHATFGGRLYCFRHFTDSLRAQN